MLWNTTTALHRPSNASLSHRSSGWFNVADPAIGDRISDLTHSRAHDHATGEGTLTTTACIRCISTSTGRSLVARRERFGTTRALTAEREAPPHDCLQSPGASSLWLKTTGTAAPVAAWTCAPWVVAYGYA